jgi:tetratricopeptide (TPR) repeat protein
MAGEQALQRAADQEAAAHLALALEFVPRLPEGREREQAELLTRLELASALIPSKGWSSAEIETHYLTALKLAEKLEDESLTSIALFGLASMYEVRGEYTRSAELVDRRMVLASPDSTAPVESLELMACSEFHRGMFEQSLEHAEQGIALYEPELYSRRAARGENAGVGCYDWAALSLLALGYPDRALRHAEEALRIAREPANRYSLSLAHGQAAVLYQLRNQPKQALEHAQAAIESGFEFGFLYHVVWSGIIEAWARVRLGDCDAIAKLKDCIQRSLESGARMDHHYYQGLLATAHQACGDLESALAVVQETLSALSGNRRFFYEPELQRLMGVFLLEQRGKEAAAEAKRWFEDALSGAASHGGRLFKLRAAIALVRLAQLTGEDPKPARDTLSRLVGAFNEGLDTPDVVEAQALLAAVNP